MRSKSSTTRSPRSSALSGNWKHISSATVLAACIFTLAASKPEVLLQTGFENKRSLDEHWSIGGGGSARIAAGGVARSNCLEIKCATPAGEEAGTGFSPQRLRRKVVIVSASVKGQDIKSATQFRDGAMVAVTIHRKTGGADTFAPDEPLDGTFDWRNVNIHATIPDDATAVYLNLGLSSATGTVWFDDVKVTVESKQSATTMPSTEPAAGTR